MISALILAAVVTFGYTGTTQDDQLAGVRAEWAGKPGIAGQFRAGQDAWSVMAGPTLALSPRAALYGLVGGAKASGYRSTGAAEIGASAQAWALRAHVGYVVAPGRSGGVAFGLGWAFDY